MAEDSLAPSSCLAKRGLAPAVWVGVGGGRKHDPIWQGEAVWPGWPQPSWEGKGVGLIPQGVGWGAWPSHAGLGGHGPASAWLSQGYGLWPSPRRRAHSLAPIWLHGGKRVWPVLDVALLGEGGLAHSDPCLGILALGRGSSFNGCSASLPPFNNPCGAPWAGFQGSVGCIWPVG